MASKSRGVNSERFGLRVVPRYDLGGGAHDERVVGRKTERDFQFLRRRAGLTVGRALLERWYATRANSHKTEVAGASHSVYVSHPRNVADIIESAARMGLK